MAVTETGHLASRAIDDLYRQHGGEVYRYAYAVLGNHADAEDVTQTTFLNAYRALEQGVRPRKPSNWLLTIASNAIKQRFRQEQARPRYVELDERLAGTEAEDDDGPSVGELLTALSKIPPQQRQAIVLREFEGRSYAEIAGILGVTTSALETLLFRARRSLAEELEHQLTCTEAQLAVSRSVDDRLGRKERRRLRDHLAECPDCASFARLQQRHRSALRGLMLIPIPLSLTLFKGLEGAGTASAATLPVAGAAGAAATGAGVATAVGAGAGVGTGVGAAGATGGGLLAGGIAVKAAAVVAAVGVAGGAAVVESSITNDAKPAKNKPAVTSTNPGQRLGQLAPRGVLIPGNGVARGKATAPGQVQRTNAPARSKAATSKAHGRHVPSARSHSASAKRSHHAAGGKSHSKPPTAKTSSASRGNAGSSQAPKQDKPAKSAGQSAPSSQPTAPATDSGAATTEPTTPSTDATRRNSGNARGNGKK
jgi:RNA polymerase sigma factor (sigma-70 family)